MDLEKLETETSRLTLEVKKSKEQWEKCLRRGFLFLGYQVLVGMVLIYFFPESFNVIVIIILSSYIWEFVGGIKVWFKLRQAKKELLTWQETVNLTNQKLK